MKFEVDNIKYCLLAWDHHEENNDNYHGSQPLPISGLFNWARVFNGVRMFPKSDKDLARFNLFHINVTLKNLFLIPTFLKRMPKDAKLMLNVDFGFELWQQSFGLYPDLFFEIIDKADFIFAVEPLQAEIISTELKRNVPVIPHPVDIKNIKLLRSEERLNQIGFSLHRYDNNILPSALIARQIPKSFQTIATGSTESKKDLLHLFDFIKEACDFKTLMTLSSQLYAVVESYTVHSYGRYSVELAALGVPCVGPRCVASIVNCFPDLCVSSPNEISEYVSNVLNLINDFDFYTEVANKASDFSEFYSFENSLKKMTKFLSQEL